MKNKCNFRVNATVLYVIMFVLGCADRSTVKTKSSLSTSDTQQQKNINEKIAVNKTENKDEAKVSAEIVNVRTESFRTATGLDTVMIYVDWKNTGNRPIRIVDAKIVGYDSDGNEVVVMPVSDYTIYADFDDRPGIAPGSIYIQPQGRGYIAPKINGVVIVKATAKIVIAIEQGMK